MGLNKQFVILLNILFFIACTSNDEPIYVAERIANIVAASTNPATDGTPSLEDLAAAGVRNATGDQTVYEEAIALASPVPTTLTELQEIINTASAGGNNNTLAWSDEFDTAGAPSSANWSYDIGAGGWGNGEAQNYTSRPENVIVEDGLLKITAKKESFGGAEYTSTRLKTQGKYSFTYGKVEVRAKLPATGGTWPAIWMLGVNFPSVGWPACGEIDIMEHTGNNINKVSSALHNPSSFGNTQNVGQTTIANTTTEFHVYAVDWTPTKMDFSVDGNVFYTYNPANKTDDNWPYDANQFIILNVAVGGTLGGAIDPNYTEDVMEIDYVRVYQ